MARGWTREDAQRWQHVEDDAASPQRKGTEPDDLLFRDVVAGCALYGFAVLLSRLRLAAPPARSLWHEIKAANDARAVHEWIYAPMSELPRDGQPQRMAEE